ncbi:hypothetical protein C2F27_11855 [Salmonella enterica]|nr:hypothetical protein [Salmonella enterica]
MMNLKAVIPVAGLGMHMLPATKAIPKEMLPIVDKPMIQYIVDEIVAAGIKEIVLVTHASKNAVENHFDTSYELESLLEQRVKRQLLAEVQSICPPGVTIMNVRQAQPLTWNTEAVVTAAGGTPVMSKTGHAFIKERMRTEDAIYGGEMSAHHYFRDFAYCDSGMIPWLLVAELVCLKGQSLGELVRDRMAAFPASGEINSRLAEPAAAIARVEAHFAEEAQAVDRTDGLSMSFADWRFNLRSSNTEPVVRLNVESRGDIPLMEARTKEILQLLNS